MRTLTAVLFLALLAPLSAAADGPNEAAKKLEGTYAVVEVVHAGKPDEKIDDVKSVEIKDGQIVVTYKKDVDKIGFTLDPSKKPGHIDLKPHGEKKLLGVYEVKETAAGTELTIAFSTDPKAERPKDFTGKGEDGVMWKLLRKKAK